MMNWSHAHAALPRAQRLTVLGVCTWLAPPQHATASSFRQKIITCVVVFMTVALSPNPGHMLWLWMNNTTLNFPLSEGKMRVRQLVSWYHPNPICHEFYRFVTSSETKSSVPICVPFSLLRRGWAELGYVWAVQLAQWKPHIVQFNDKITSHIAEHRIEVRPFGDIR